MFWSKILKSVVAATLLVFQKQPSTALRDSTFSGTRIKWTCIRHQLIPNDYQRRSNFSQWFNGRCEQPHFLENLVIGDEATFSMNGVVNILKMYGIVRQKKRQNFTLTEAMLRQKIVDEFNALRHNPEIFTRAVRCRFMHARTTVCLARNGGHVER